MHANSSLHLHFKKKKVICFVASVSWLSSHVNLYPSFIYLQDLPNYNHSAFFEALFIQVCCHFCIHDTSTVSEDAETPAN